GRRGNPVRTQKSDATLPLRGTGAVAPAEVTETTAAVRPQEDTQRTSTPSRAAEKSASVPTPTEERRAAREARVQSESARGQSDSTVNQAANQTSQTSSQAQQNDKSSGN